MSARSSTSKSLIALDISSGSMPSSKSSRKFSSNSPKTSPSVSSCIRSQIIFLSCGGEDSITYASSLGVISFNMRPSLDLNSGLVRVSCIISNFASKFLLAIWLFYRIIVLIQLAKIEFFSNRIIFHFIWSSLHKNFPLIQ